MIGGLVVAFSSWDDFETAVKDALQDFVEDKPAMQSFAIGSRNYTARSVDEFEKLLKLAKVMKSMDDTGDYTTMVAYGQLIE